MLPLQAPSLLRDTFDGSHVVQPLERKCSCLQPDTPPELPRPSQPPRDRLSLPQTWCLAPTVPQEAKLCAAFNSAWRVRLQLGLGLVQGADEHNNNVRALAWVNCGHKSRQLTVANAIGLLALPTNFLLSTLESCGSDHWSESCHDVVDGACVLAIFF